MSHQYLVPGNFTIVVTATDTAGDRLVRTHAVSVSGPPRAAPTVTGGPNVTEGLAPLPVGFAASASGGAGGPYAYGWAFGDGATTTGAFANHTYPAPGSYAANLTVTDRIGTRTIDRFAIAVYNVTPVDLAFGPVANATRVGIGSTVDGSLTVLPTCTVASVPGCGPAAVGVELGWASVGGAVNVSVAVGHATSTGRFDFSVPGPTAAGTYVLYALAVGPNFTGYAAVPVTVLAAGAPAPPLAPAWFLGVGLIAAAAVGIGGYVLVRRRRRRPDADLPASP